MNAKLFVVVLALVGIGCIGGYVLHDLLARGEASEHRASESTSQQIRQNSEYTYINPLLECEVAEGLLDARKENFHEALGEFTADLKTSGQIREVAVYFRDLNNGPTFGIYESGDFFPASLLKVPVMMAYYRWAERNPNLLNTEIHYQEAMDFGYTPTIIPRETLTIGQSYTVAELIRRMIVYSDNQSLHLLTKNLPMMYLQELFKMLGVGEDVLVDPEAKLTVKEYAGFFRILFNSSYLSRESSEKALALLAATDYHDALPAGVPPNIAVAHKFGEAGTGDTDRQLHDCGIVYFPDHPYLACIMTRGDDTVELKDSIAAISKFIYEKIDEQY